VALALHDSRTIIRGGEHSICFSPGPEIRAGVIGLAVSFTICLGVVGVRQVVRFGVRRESLKRRGRVEKRRTSDVGAGASTMFMSPGLIRNRLSNYEDKTMERRTILIHGVTGQSGGAGMPVARRYRAAASFCGGLTAQAESGGGGAGRRWARPAPHPPRR